MIGGMYFRKEIKNSETILSMSVMLVATYNEACPFKDKMIELEKKDAGESENILEHTY